MALEGKYAPRGVLDLLSQNADDAHEALRSEPTACLKFCDYQLAAIRAIEALEGGNRSCCGPLTPPPLSSGLTTLPPSHPSPHSHEPQHCPPRRARARAGLAAAAAFVLVDGLMVDVATEEASATGAASASHPRPTST